MILSRFVKIQLVIFAILTVIALVIMGIVYMRLPSLAGVGRYTVSIELATSGGLYNSANVTYRGKTVGIVTGVAPTAAGAVATLNMDSSARIPVSAKANVHSRSAIGEQYVDFVPTSSEGPFLHNGDVVPVTRTTVPQDIAPLIDTLNASLTSIPQDKLTTLIEETHNAFGGTGNALQRLLNGADRVLDQANADTDSMTTLINDSASFLDSQQVSSPAMREWVAHLANSVQQAQANDQHIQDILATGPGAAREASDLFQRLHLTTPLLVANLTSLGQVAVTYNASIEQLLVLLPASVSALKTINVPDSGGTNRAFLDFKLNLNAPPPCTTGFLPGSERRDGSSVDAPTRTPDPIFCAIPADAPNASRGARNLPCMDVPGKRAPTVDICKSDEQYVPQGTNPWLENPTPAVGGPAAPADARTPEPTPQVGTASYDPGSGSYVGSDGRAYSQPGLVPGSVQGPPTLQTLLTGGHC
ncbi:MCE family protein [Nocardia sp. NBC_00565]|uniref:MCE family protein n=1 Tax=Nocardia sp. NBC_00565 TaxID=2975993 RepID=UPI002E822644|nr:MCE family protein [Nocardia sp. NBC_00565]WUC06694.1 MCE family protein [Nocardia sp. NBC_00565]